MVWGSSFILNTPVVTVYRWGIYLLMEHLGVSAIIKQIVICILAVVTAYKMLFS